VRARIVRSLSVTDMSSYVLVQRVSPPLHLTTSKVMVIAWRLRGYIIRTVLYCQRATSSMGTVNKNSSYSPVGPGVCLFVFFRLHDLSLCSCVFCFTLVS